jgi:nitroimidazol reductase NimA-like FMN-containing flavoprotein (pyridoxamine 5'-phosphate oxidase superfamily)
MTDETAAIDLDHVAREVLDGIRYIVLGTIDEDGTPRTSPVFFTPHGYEYLYWVSHPDTHHGRNLARDDRVGGVVFDSSLPPGQSDAVYVTGTAREIPEGELVEHLPVAFDPERRGGTRFTADQVVGSADLRLWVLQVDHWEVHVRAGHPEYGTGRDRRVVVDPRRGRG